MSCRLTLFRMAFLMFPLCYLPCGTCGTRHPRTGRARRTACAGRACRARRPGITSRAGAIWELFCSLFAVFRERLVRYKFVVDMNVPRLIAVRLFSDGDKLDELQAHFTRKLLALAVAFEAGYVLLGIRLNGVRLGKPLFKFGNALLRAFFLRLIFLAQISAHALREITQHFLFKSRLNELIQLRKVDFLGVVILNSSNILLAWYTPLHLIATAESVFQRASYKNFLSIRIYPLSLV